MISNISFGPNLKKLRKHKNITQQQLASEINVSRTTVCAWEKNQTEPDLSTLKKLKNFFDVEYEDLLDN